jgi:FkbM family methyltransferase
VDPDLIIDVGMHRGEDTEFYLKKGFRVVAVEANPTLCHECEEKLANFIRDGRLRIINKAIAEEAGSVAFFINEVNSVWGTTSSNWRTRNLELYGADSREITVEAISFRELLLEHGVPYYLKIDIEGSDLLCLRALETIPCKPKFVSIESSISSFDETFEQFAVLHSLGYRRYKIVPQQRIASMTPPFPPREKQFVAHRFKPGASGLFGDETPGNWIDLEAAVGQYLAIHRRIRRFGETRHRSNLVRAVLRRLRLAPGWYDTHAMLKGED